MQLLISFAPLQRERKKVTTVVAVSYKCAYNYIALHHSGAWSESEEQRLVSAIEQCCGDHYLEDTQLPLSVTWDNIADLVGTRNGPQCRSKWHFYLSWKERGGTKAWDIQDDLKLLQALSDQDNNDEDEVNWEGLTGNWASARSPFYLRSKWACLRRFVPQYSINSYQG